MRRPTRLVVDALADRIVPAFDLAIDGDLGTVGVSEVFAAGTTTFTANGPGATLSVADIAAALALGHVDITTGAGGAQAGNITWVWDSPADDLAYFGPPNRTLTLQTIANGADITLDGVTLAFADNVFLLLDTTQPATDGDIVLANAASVFSTQQATLSAGAGTVRLGATLESTSGPVLVNGSTVFAADSTVTAAGFASILGAVDLAAGGLTVRAGTTATLGGTVDGANDLTVGGTAVVLGGAVNVADLLIADGTVSAGAFPISADTVTVGDGFPFPGPVAEFGAVAGLVTAPGGVAVNTDGVIAPGGTGVVGTLMIAGDLTFAGGDYRIDVGPTSDRVTLTGTLTVQPGSTLGDAESTNELVAADGDQVVIESASQAGAFDNAPVVLAKFLVGTDALQLGTAANGVSVRQASRELNNTATGADPDGTGYTAKLTGVGRLVRARDYGGGLVLVTTDTTDKSVVTVTTKANASDNRLGLAGVYVNGRIGSVAGKTVTLDGPFLASGPVKTLALGDAFGPITLGGTTADKTALTLASGFSEVSAPGTLSLTAAGNFGGVVTANALGAVKVGGTLFGAGQDWDIATGIASLTAADIQGLSVQAGSIGTLSTTGGGPGKVAGDIANSAFVLDGSAGGFGLKTLTAKGSVRASQFDVQAGNVSAVTVGRFIDSQLFLRYTPGLDFLSGTFTGAATLGKFTTTAKELKDVNHPLNWAFAGSQVAAPALGSVRLSGLKTVNAGGPSGFQFDTVAGSVRTASSDFPAFTPPNTNLTPDRDGTPTALVADFYYFDTTP